MAEKKSWRDILAVHPAAELFPLMSEPELRELGEDIKKNKLQIPIVVWRRGDQYKKPKQYSLLDGRNRLDAMELVGIPFQLHWRERYHFWDLDSDCISDNAVTVEVQNADPYEFVLSANAHRRHLTAEQKRELIAELLKAKPQASNNAVAKQVKADDKTVAKVRREMEGRSEIPNVETRTDTRGRKQPAKRKKADDNPKVTTPVPETSAEPSGSWMVRAIDDEGGCWSSGVRLRTKQEGAAYMGMWAYGALRDEPHTIMEIRVIKSNDEPNIWIAKNKKGHHRTLCFEHGQCGLLKWKRDAQSCPLMSGDEVPHIFTRKSRLRSGEFLITSAKRLLQQYRHFSDLSQCSGMSAAGESRRRIGVRPLMVDSFMPLGKRVQALPIHGKSSRPIPVSFAFSHTGKVSNPSGGSPL